MSALVSPRSAYLVGAGIGLLSCLAFALVDKPIGMSTAVAAISGTVAMPLVGIEAVQENPYWAKNGPAWDYGTLFLIGTFLGALIHALATRSFRWRFLSDTWRERFGATPLARGATAFAGGVLALYGARLAGGCTSGHGISGTLQLAVSSWLFFAVMLAAGILVARLLFSSPRMP